VLLFAVWSVTYAGAGFLLCALLTNLSHLTLCCAPYRFPTPADRCAKRPLPTIRLVAKALRAITRRTSSRTACGLC